MSSIMLITRRTFVALALSAALGSSTVACSSGAEGQKEVPVSNKVQMEITEDGYSPRNITVKQGEPVTLTITRKTDKTCGTEIVIDEYNINVKLPLNQPVTVTFTPTKTGKLKYGCAMNKMVGGVITVI